MDFDLSDDQRLLKESVDRLLADRYDFDSRGRHADHPEGFSPELWREFAELGLLGLPFDEVHGGFGGTPVETMIVMEAFGRALVLEPFLASVILGGGLLRHGGSDAQRAEMLPRIADGTMRLAFAHLERQSRYDLADVATTAVRDGAGWVLSGAKGLVLHGDSADRIVVTARSAGGRRDRDGIGLFLVEAEAPGVTRRGYATQDGQRAAEIALSRAPAVALGDPEGGLPIAERVIDEAIAALCAEAVGAMAVSLDATVDYLKTRKQFGRAIGDFQVLQHRCVDMYVAAEQARSITMFATMMAGSADPVERRRAVSAAKVQVGRSARLIGQESIQLHGGIGMTMEYKVGHYFKRLTMIEGMYGDADFHLGVVADLGSMI